MSRCNLDWVIQNWIKEKESIGENFETQQFSVNLKKKSRQELSYISICIPRSC